MNRRCVVTRVHHVHINEIKLWALEEVKRAQAAVDPLDHFVDEILAISHKILDPEYKTLFPVPDTLDKAAAITIARRAQRVLMEANLNLCARYDALSHKIVLVAPAKVKEICWFSRGRRPAMKVLVSP